MYGNRFNFNSVQQLCIILPLRAITYDHVLLRAITCRSVSSKSSIGHFAIKFTLLIADKISHRTADNQANTAVCRCLGWSESSLGAHAILLVLSWGGLLYPCVFLFYWGKYLSGKGIENHSHFLGWHQVDFDNHFYWKGVGDYYITEST